MYTASKNGKVIIRDLDGAHIPIDDANTDYKDVLEWQSEGGEIGKEIDTPDIIAAGKNAEIDKELAGHIVEAVTALVNDDKQKIAEYRDKINQTIAKKS